MFLYLLGEYVRDAAPVRVVVVVLPLVRLFQVPRVVRLLLLWLFVLGIKFSLKLAVLQFQVVRSHHSFCIGTTLQ